MNREVKNVYRKKKIKVILTIIAILLPINAAIMLYGNYMFKNEQERIKYMRYTEYDLNKWRMDYLIQMFDIYIPEYKNAPMTFFTDNMYNPDKDKYELAKGEDCEEQIEKINSLLFDENNDEYKIYESTREKVAEYGFDENNPITSDWIITHPNEGLEMLLLSGDGDEMYNSVADSLRYGMEYLWTEYGCRIGYTE